MFQKKVLENIDYNRYKLLPFIENDLSAEHRQNLIQKCSSFEQNLHFAIYWNKNNISFFVWIPNKYQKYFINMFYGIFPSSSLEKQESIPKFIKKLYKNKNVKNIKFFDPNKVASLEHFFKTQTTSSEWFESNYYDPLKDMLSLYNSVDEWIFLTIFFTIRYKKTYLEQIIEKFIKNKKIKWKKEEIEDKKIENNKKTWFSDNSAFLSIKILTYKNKQYSNSTSYIKAKETIETNIIAYLQSFLINWKLKIKNTTQWNLLKLWQITNFFHLPTKNYFIKWLEYSKYKKLPYPNNLPIIKSQEDLKHITLIGKTDYRTENITFGIKNEDKFRHIYIVWKTWTGKSTFLSNLIKSDIEQWKWLCLLDPHGDLVELCLKYIPQNRLDDVILFDIWDQSYPIWFNLLQYKNPEEKSRIVSWIVWVFYKLFSNSRWPRLEYVLRNVLLSIIEYPNATLMHLLRMLTENKFRKNVLKYVKDPILLKFRKEEFWKRTQKQIQETIWPITNKVWQFLSSPIVRNIFWQYETKLDLREIMDKSKILLINLSKWKIWEDNSSMIGSLIVSKLQVEAMWRADLPINQRKDFFLYIDEFQNFATNSFATILSEARKYKLSLIVANQYTNQLEENIKSAIFGNVWTIISFTLWYDDATVIKPQFKDMVSTNDLISLPRFTAYTRLMIDWQSSNPFNFKTLPLSNPTNNINIITQIKKQSRTKYWYPKEKLEQLMNEWYQYNFVEQEKIIKDAINKSKENNPNNKIEQISLNQNWKKLSINDIILWKKYEWYIKLKYNYWVFVTVNWLDWLLHKSNIKVPDWYDNWKKAFNIWDKIKVIAERFVEVDWEKRIVRTM